MGAGFDSPCGCSYDNKSSTVCEAHNMLFDQYELDCGCMISKIDQGSYCYFHKSMPTEIKEAAIIAGGKKNDTGKPPMALVSSVFIEEIAKVLDFGRVKYSAWNWKEGFVWSRVASAILRHTFAWLRGEDKDPETGLSHLSHAACGLMFLIDFEINKIGQDDRYKPNSDKQSDLRQG